MANAKDIETAFENRSASDVAAGAHKLKSSSRSVGATELADICNGLETAGKNDDWNTINELVPRLPGVMQKIGDYIENL
jgi:HPt (histidine-containing phosphotransfer) domain-containing protein